MEQVRRRALGRGLDALIPAGQRRPLESTGEGHPATLPVAAIAANPLQPRQRFLDAEIDELVSSIKQNGVLQPLIVRRGVSGFELIAGERRLRAAQRAGLELVPVVVREATDQQALELALIENLQREDLNPLDAAVAYRRLMAEFGLTQDEVAQKVAKSRPAVANSLRLLQLPAAVQAQIRAGRLSEGHARAIAGAATAAAQERAMREVAERRLNVRETEKLVRDLGKRDDVDRAAVEGRLRQALGTKVRVVARANGRGRIEIEYFSLAELDGLLDRLAPA